MDGILNSKTNTFVFIRHGATTSNLEKKYCGKASDEDLCEEGKNALIKRKEEGLYPPVEYLFCGKKKRCISTAEIIYPGQTYKIPPEFDEIDFGDFEGKSFEELKGNPDYQKWLESGGALPFPNGESREEYVWKMMKGFQKIATFVPEDSTVGIVAHGGTIMAILSTISGKGYFDFQAHCGCGYICKIYGDENMLNVDITELG